MLYIFKAMILKIYLFSLYLHDILLILFFTELFQDLRQMQEAWLAEGIS